MDCVEQCDFGLSNHQELRVPQNGTARQAGFSLKERG
jgi:hypothetical protein